MIMTTFIITFGSNAVQFSAASVSNEGVAKITAEPLRSNTHACWVGNSAVTNDASGTGVIKQLGIPPTAAGGLLEQFNLEHNESKNVIDNTQFYAHGTSGEKLLVTYWQF